jgi:shikimate dehydrogenase
VDLDHTPSGTVSGWRAGVLGKPIAHSLSPVIHNAGYAAAGLTGWAYEARECAESELADLVAGLGSQWRGLSLTMPLKEAALPVAERVTPLAAAIGAANTLVRLPSGGWGAENTDAPGMVDALREAGVVSPGEVAVLGAGGTARAAVAAAGALGAATVRVYARRPEAIAALVPVARCSGVALVGVDWADATAARRLPVVVSTVPKGVADSLAGADWSASGVLLDAVYDPWPTPLAAAAAAAGCRIVSGLDLLLAQAVRQFEMFTATPAPVEAMRAALTAAAAARARG